MIRLAPAAGWSQPVGSNYDADIEADLIEPMKNAKQKLELFPLLYPAAWTGSVFLRDASRLIFLTILLWLPIASQAGGAYDAAMEQRFGEPRGSTNIAPAKIDPQQAVVERALKADELRRTQAPPVAPSMTPLSRIGLLSLVTLLLAAVLALLRIVKVLNDRLANASALAQVAAERELRDRLIAEEPTLVSFFTALRDGLGTSVDGTSAGIHAAAEKNGSSESKEEENRRLQEFFELAPNRIDGILAQFSKISNAPHNAGRAELLRQFFDLVEGLKQEATMPQLRPIWLMACGLGGLTHQLMMNLSNLNPSVLRAVFGAVNMLKALCVPGLDPALATRSPVELLAVDDNPICLAALSMALKKAFRQPDLAAEGQLALALAEKKKYDAIFLDIEMPGMDGFELCSKIRATELNRGTPVVFVTSHGDFESRAKSASVGGQDLIAKPYLSFEITVKALTLVLRGRLASDNVEHLSTDKEPIGLDALAESVAASEQSSAADPLAQAV